MFMIERRKAKRKQLINYPAVFNRDDYQIIGRMINASVEGALISCDEQVRNNTDFLFKLALPKAVNGNNNIAIEAKSIWCQIDEETGYYNAGFKLLSTSSSNKTIFDQMIQNYGYDYY